MMFPKLLEILFYQALTLICLLSYQAAVKVCFSLWNLCQETQYIIQV